MKNYILLPVLLMLFLGSCKEDDPIPPTTYTLTTIVAPSGGGEIFVSPKSDTYTEGEVVTLTPVPNENFVFQEWGGSKSGNSNPLELTMNSNKSILGVFVEKGYPLNITIEGEGTAEERIIPNPSGREYPGGTVVELTAHPKAGWEFDSWEGDLTGDENPSSIIVEAEKNVTVRFKRIEYSLNIQIEGEGTVEEKVTFNPSGRTYPFETEVELTPIPEEGWVFIGWGGDITGIESPKTIVVDGTKNNIIATFRQSEVFYLNANGITCMCPNASPGEKGIIDGIEYEAVDRGLLEKRRDEGADLTKVCTSLVTDMDELFLRRRFNQPIGNWDVSNVVNMADMFDASNFNQPIEHWDVSNVTNMRGMFAYNDFFNQPIGNWDVGNVVSMRSMFEHAEFNQRLDDWDVSNVVDMSSMFERSEFNLPIGDWDVGNLRVMRQMFEFSNFNQPLASWDVSNVRDMYSMFQGTTFNRQIGNWDVSNVTDMRFMFMDSKFNQPLADWDVKNVVYMGIMFYRSQFNQDISSWCVSEHQPKEPQGFSAESPLIEVYKPVWGTCPE